MRTVLKRILSITLVLCLCLTAIVFADAKQGIKAKPINDGQAKKAYIIAMENDTAAEELVGKLYGSQARYPDLSCKYAVLPAGMSLKPGVVWGGEN